MEGGLNPAWSTDYGMQNDDPFGVYDTGSLLGPPGDPYPLQHLHQDRVQAAQVLARFSNLTGNATEPSVNAGGSSFAAPGAGLYNAGPSYTPTRPFNSGTLYPPPGHSYGIGQSPNQAFQLCQSPCLGEPCDQQDCPDAPLYDDMCTDTACKEPRCSIPCELASHCPGGNCNFEACNGTFFNQPSPANAFGAPWAAAGGQPMLGGMSMPPQFHPEPVAMARNDSYMTNQPEMVTMDRMGSNMTNQLEAVAMARNDSNNSGISNTTDGSGLGIIMCRYAGPEYAAGNCCGATFPDRELLHFHVLEHHGLPPTPPGGKRPRRKNSKGSKPPYYCWWADCKRHGGHDGKGFDQSQHLKDHLSTHTQYKPVKCPAPGCGRAFKDQKELKQHNTCHTGERRYACPHCDATYSHQPTLKVHIRSAHTKEKPFICDVCEHADADKANYKRHCETHRAPKYWCSWCGRRFPKKSNKVRHEGTCNERKEAEKREKERLRALGVVVLPGPLPDFGPGPFADVDPMLSDAVSPQPVGAFGSHFIGVTVGPDVTFGHNVNFGHGLAIGQNGV